jgi:apolipoprotein N-acyltransferase
MIEYSQYKQLPIIQITSIVGGIGLAFIILMVNTAIAGLIATFSQRLSFKALASANKTSSFVQVLSLALLVVASVAWGMSRLETPLAGGTVPVTVVQGNINIEMQKAPERFSLAKLTEHYVFLAEKAPPGLCIFTESALPTYLRQEKLTEQILSGLARSGHHDLVVGSIDRDDSGSPFNSAFGITADGELLNTVYHKRYLVPFGEYMPNFVHFLPDFVQKLTSTPAGRGFISGKIPVVLDLSGHRIAPLICFETLSPELVTTSVRNGGQLLVNLSDLAWFHDSMVGDQMTAFSVMRAVESGRSFVFAANTGPSVIISPRGHIIEQSKVGRPGLLVGKAQLSTELTPFTQWFN